MMEDVRALLDEKIAQSKATYSDISRLIGRNPAYIQQFIKRGTPRRLDEQDRRTIARFLGISEHLLSGLPLEGAEPAPPSKPARSVSVPRLSLGASAGAGALDIDESASDSVAIDSRWLQDIGVRPPYVSIIRVDGESMTPTLNHGDEIMVDHSDNMSRLRDGIYVLRLDDVLLVKRVAMGLRRDEFSILSDNSLYPSRTNVDPALVTIVGRVVWSGRIFR
ncbi:S24 family peptidase [Sphingobium sp. SA916]|uniref:S24 family peptidase n=1 Tax=Sphingobium sp. SA916 TaxID=1851207 RepID=UPI000C9EE39A|nr:S24 family peptidase [Sphingobium sp. SA916]PNP95785.1 peptidase S24 [Sphingobium sp. SA916]